jgi:phage tail-like protein
MPGFVVNPLRFDPYKNYKFRVKWDGRYIYGVDQVSGLRRRTDVVSHREGGDPAMVRRSPGQTVYDPIVLVRGRSHDSAFEEWANKVWDLGGGNTGEISLPDFRKDIVIDLLNEAGQKAMSFMVYRCWPSEYEALGDLAAAESCVATESLTLQHEGWERDYAVGEPREIKATPRAKRRGR